NLLSFSFDFSPVDDVYTRRERIGGGIASTATKSKKRGPSVSDIFISYANEDRDRVLPLVSALEKTGWSIFWDRTIPAGNTWHQVIDFEIQACRSVLVVWTVNSVVSEWVKEEAHEGKLRGILIPVLLDNVKPPLGFRGIQAADLVGWNGDSSSP